jgi:hypothetical protein
VSLADAAVLFRAVALRVDVAFLKGAI